MGRVGASPEGIATNLLHDTGLPLRKCNVTTRLVGDKLDLDLPALATGLIVIIVVVVGWPLALDATSIIAWEGVRIGGGLLLEGGGRSIVVLVGDVGHVHQRTCQV